MSASVYSTSIIWDMESEGVGVKNFYYHKVNVMSRSIILTNKSLFVTKSVDSTSNARDIYSGKCVQTHVDHEYDINLVSLFLDENFFGSGSDELICNFF